MRRFTCMEMLPLLAVALVLSGGCPKPPAAQPAAPAGPQAVAAAPATNTPAPAETATGTWGCLYESTGGVYWLSAEAGAKPVQVVALTGAEEDSLSDFAISADGARLAVVSGSWKCEAIDLATGERTPVWAADKDPGPMAWSPDGKSLAYVQGGVLSVLPLGGTATTLVSDKRVSAVAWSPDGKQIAYGRRDANDQDLGLFVIPAAGGTVRQLAKGTKDVFGAADIAWSPDGKQIAFMHAWEGGALCFVKADGTGYRPDVGPAFGQARWLSDQSAVVYTAMANEMETLGIYRCAPGGKPEAIVKGKAVSFDMLSSGRLLAIISPHSEGKQQSQVKVLAAPRATAQVEWKQDVPGNAISGFFQPDGSHLALWVGEKEKQTLWMGATGQPLTKRADDVKRLMGWANGPGH